jgi:hypothetical protein
MADVTDNADVTNNADGPERAARADVADQADMITPADVIGLMAAAIRSDDPVVFFEHKGLFASKGPAAPEGHVVELGRAAVVRVSSAVGLLGLCLGRVAKPVHAYLDSGRRLLPGRTVTAGRVSNQ